MAGRKKIRGFGRHLRRHQRWARRLPTPSFDRLRRDHHDYQKLGLSPWFTSEKPPLPIRKLWVAHLLASYQHWQQELSLRYPQFYLAIWLFEPDFGYSELVAGIEDRAERYESLFQADEQAARFPAEYAALRGATDLVWTCCPNLEAFYPEDLLENRWLAAKKQRPYQAPGGEELVLVEIGRVWVGRAAGPDPA